MLVAEPRRWSEEGWVFFVCPGMLLRAVSVLGWKSPFSRYLIRVNPPMPLRIAYRRILCLIALWLSKIPSKSTVLVW